MSPSIFLRKCSSFRHNFHHARVINQSSLLFIIAGGEEKADADAIGFVEDDDGDEYEYYYEYYYETEGEEEEQKVDVERDATTGYNQLKGRGKR